MKFLLLFVKFVFMCLFIRTDVHSVKLEHKISRNRLISGLYGSSSISLQRDMEGDDMNVVQKEKDTIPANLPQRPVATTGLPANATTPAPIRQPATVRVWPAATLTGCPVGHGIQCASSKRPKSAVLIFCVRTNNCEVLYMMIMEESR